MIKYLKKIEYKKVLFYVFIFLVFLFYTLIVCPLNLDEIWNYGFAHNIYNGLIPYKDFNMVITPFYPFIMSISFHIFGSSMLVFHIENALIITVLSYFLFKLLGEKAWLVILFLFFPLSVSFPSYNLFLFFLLVLVIFLEKKDGNDYLIGILLSLLCLTKQSVGVCLLLSSLYYIKDLDKIKKRIIGFLGPCLIFLIYLIITNSLYSFFDLCLFGLFDFAEGNGKSFNIYYLLFIILIFITLYFIKKDRGNITNYYTLAFFSILIPLFDTYHFQVMFLAFLLMLLEKFDIPKKFNIRLFVFGIIIGISFVSLTKRFDGEVIYPNNINHFEYRLLDTESIEFTNEVNNFINKYDNREFVFLDSNGYYFRIINDLDIGYIDLINKGNWGYNGSDKLFSEFMKKKDAIFIVDKSELSEIKQTDKRVIKYVINNGTKIKSIGIYDIYELN